MSAEDLQAKLEEAKKKLDDSETGRVEAERQRDELASITQWLELEAPSFDQKLAEIAEATVVEFRWSVFLGGNLVVLQSYTIEMGCTEAINVCVEVKASSLDKESLEELHISTTKTDFDGVEISSP